MKIWYQSYVDYENGKTYWDRLRMHLAAEFRSNPKGL